MDMYGAWLHPYSLGFQALGVLTDIRLVTHFQFPIVGPDRETVTKRPYNWSSGLILDAFCTTFRA